MSDKAIPFLIVPKHDYESLRNLSRELARELDDMANNIPGSYESAVKALATARKAGLLEEER